MGHVEKSIEVERPVQEVYAQWTQFEEFPKFMENVEEVTQLDAKRLRWRARIAGKEQTWEAEITEQQPDRVIAWRSLAGARNDGTVRFAGENGRTRVTLSIDYEPHSGMEKAGDALLQVTPRHVEGDLKRFKEFIEKREEPTGRWEGRIESGQVKE